MVQPIVPPSKPKSDLSQLKKLVSELTANAQTDEQKTQLIYAWVQNNIKYIAFEDGLGGFVPRSSRRVSKKIRRL